MTPVTLIWEICTPPRTERKVTLVYVLIGALTLMVAVVLGPAVAVAAVFPVFPVLAAFPVLPVAADAGDAGSAAKIAKPVAMLPVRVRAEGIRRMEECLSFPPERKVLPAERRLRVTSH